MKIAVLGLDGADYHIISHYMEKGVLPNLKELKEGGVFGPLRSTLPPVTGVSWTSCITGKNPGKIGIFDFAHMENFSKFRITTSKDRKSRSVWNYLSEHGYKVGILNVPITYPPEKVNGFMVSGFGAPENGKMSNPPTIIDELTNHFGRYDLHLNKVVAQQEEYGEWLFKIAEKQTKIIKYLIKRYKNLNFFMTVFQVTDWVQHHFGAFADRRTPVSYLKRANKYRYLQENFFNYIDEKLGKILSELIDENWRIFIISDHGFGPIPRHLDLNIILSKLGLISLKKKNLKYYIRRYNIDEIVFNTLIKLRIIKFVIKTLDRLNLWSGVKVGQTNLFSPKNVDWNKTLAFSYGYPTKIYLNPRFKNERVKIIEEIKKELLKIKIPGSELPVVKRIYTKDEIYHGPYIDRAPEIVIELNEPPHYFEIEEKDQKPLLIQYGHRMDGIVLCYGEGIRRGSKINNATIYDVAPTILHMFNVPIPKDMDGRVLKGIFDENSEFYKREVVYSETVGERERIKTKIAKLRALKKF